MFLLKSRSLHRFLSQVILIVSSTTEEWQRSIMLSRVSGSQCLWRHSSVKNMCVKEAACVDLYDGNELSQVVPSVVLQ